MVSIIECCGSCGNILLHPLCEEGDSYFDRETLRVALIQDRELRDPIAAIQAEYAERVSRDFSRLWKGLFIDVKVVKCNNYNIRRILVGRVNSYLKIPVSASFMGALIATYHRPQSEESLTHEATVISEKSECLSHVAEQVVNMSKIKRIVFGITNGRTSTMCVAGMNLGLLPDSPERNAVLLFGSMEGGQERISQEAFEHQSVKSLLKLSSEKHLMLVSKSKTVLVAVQPSAVDKIDPNTNRIYSAAMHALAKIDSIGTNARTNLDYLPVIGYLYSISISEGEYMEHKLPEFDSHVSLWEEVVHALGLKIRLTTNTASGKRPNGSVDVSREIVARVYARLPVSVTMEILPLTPARLQHVYKMLFSSLKEEYPRMMFRTKLWPIVMARTAVSFVKMIDASPVPDDMIVGSDLENAKRLINDQVIGWVIRTYCYFVDCKVCKEYNGRERQEIDVKKDANTRRYREARPRSAGICAVLEGLAKLQSKVKNETSFTGIRRLLTNEFNPRAERLARLLRPRRVF